MVAQANTSAKSSRAQQILSGVSSGYVQVNVTGLFFSAAGGALFGGAMGNPGSLANPQQAAIIESAGKGAFMGILGGVYTVAFSAQISDDPRSKPHNLCSKGKPDAIA